MKSQQDKTPTNTETDITNPTPDSADTSADTATSAPQSDQPQSDDNPKKSNEEKNKPKTKIPKRVKVDLKKVPVGPGNFWNNMLSTVLLLIFVMALFSFFAEQRPPAPTELTLSDVVTQIKAGEVSDIVVRGTTLEINYNIEDWVPGEAKREVDTSVTDSLTNLGVTTDELSAITIDVQRETGFAYWLAVLSPFLIPLLFLGIIIWFFMRTAKGAGMQALNFGSSKARMIDPEDNQNKITFKDVAGAKEAKRELEEIVDFLKDPKKFIAIGAEIPKGVMMMGSPGTGKTLLARAVAGEAGVPFFSISGSEFVEMFVGVGASRVRDLFTMAKKSAPAIIFIDEIDAVGRMRGTGMGGGNDEREQTLNQILVEMDGFEPNAKVIVMAATNRPDVLDSALLRPGRFDRRVTIDLPDRKDRVEILKVHVKKKKLQDDVNLDIIAQRTPGFSGAELYSLVNEAAILAAREDRKQVGQFDLIRSIEKVMLGPERKSHVMSRYEKEVTAYHEVGHALVASVLPYADPVQKISIISRGRAAGYTLKLPDQDRRMHTRKEFMDDIAMTLGGYVTEEMVFGDLSTGPSNDLQVIANLARDMVTKYGMSNELGPVALEGTGGRMIGGAESRDRGFSPQVAQAIDLEVAKIIKEGKDTAREILTKHRTALNKISKRLLEVETMEREEYEALLKQEGVPINDAFEAMYGGSKDTADPTKSVA